MTTTETLDGLTLHSTIEADGRFSITLDNAELPPPGPGRVIVRIEAAPINPSDIGLLLGAVDLETLHRDGDGESAALRGKVPAERLMAMAARFGQALPVGNEGAGTVVAAGAGGEHLLGQTVAVFGGAMYAQYRNVAATACMPLLPGTSAAQGAAAFVNPLSALAMVETMRMEGHSALVHTAAASNLGQMLVRLCQAEAVPLVNIVRSEEQAKLLKDMGAAHICNSASATFRDDLVAAISATGATLAFDAIGGGALASDILSSMERSLSASGANFNRYGSAVHKQIYVYGGLDMRPLVLDRSFGLAWGVGGWLLTPFLEKIGPARVNELQAKIAAELGTTFASSYGAEISLADMLDPAVVRRFAKRATGAKFLLNPML